MHYMIISSNRDFLFEFTDQLNLTLYAHLINVETRNILMCNDFEKTIHLLRNCRVDCMIKVDFLNIFQMKSKIYDLIMKASKIQHKSS